MDLARPEVLLRERRAKEPDLDLDVEASEEGEHARVVEVLDLAKRTGVARVGLSR